MRRKISQAEARALRRRVQVLETVLEDQKNHWSEEWPRGVNIGYYTVGSPVATAIRTARKLGHAVVVTVSEGRTDAVKFFAIGLPG